MQVISWPMSLATRPQEEPPVDTPAPSRCCTGAAPFRAAHAASVVRPERRGRATLSDRSTWLEQWCPTCHAAPGAGCGRWLWGRRGSRGRVVPIAHLRVARGWLERPSRSPAMSTSCWANSLNCRPGWSGTLSGCSPALCRRARSASWSSAGGWHASASTAGTGVAQRCSSWPAGSRPRSSPTSAASMSAPRPSGRRSRDDPGGLSSAEN